jgi:hypothetical protein
VGIWWEFETGKRERNGRETAGVGGNLKEVFKCLPKSTRQN